MLSFVLAAASTLALTHPVLAHITFKPDTVPFEGSYYRTALRVPHGCGQGDTELGTRVYYPVFKIETTVPASLTAEGTVRPEWIPGWKATFEEHVRVHSASF